MPKVATRIDQILTEVEGHLNSAYTGLTKIYRGWPNLDLDASNIPCACLIVSSLPMEPSGSRGAMIQLNLMIVVLLPLPTDKSLNLQDERLKEADKLIALLESRFAWDGGWVNSYVTEVEVGDAPLGEEPISRIVIDFRAESHHQLGT